MRFPKSILALGACIALWSSPAGAEELSTLLKPVTDTRGLHTADAALLDRLLQYGLERELNIFEVFDDVILDLKASGSRLRIPGSTFRAAAEQYDLGRERAEALLPPQKITDIYLGTRLSVNDSEIDVFLSEEHSQYLEIADITLSTHYGFKHVEGRLFSQGFGARVKRFLFRFTLDKIDLYERNKIAIYVEDFGRPKRWRIDKIIRKE